MKLELDLTPNEVQVLLRALNQREEFLMSLWGEAQLTQVSKERSSMEINKVNRVKGKIMEAVS